MTKVTSSINLPFVGERKRPRKNQLKRDFWCNVVSTGDLKQDQTLGSQYAYLALRTIKKDDFAPMLGWIVIDMIEHKCPENIVLGFFQIVADVCLGNYEIPTEPLLAPLSRRGCGKAMHS